MLSLNTIDFCAFFVSLELTNLFFHYFHLQQCSVIWAKTDVNFGASLLKVEEYVRMWCRTKHQSHFQWNMSNEHTCTSDVSNIQLLKYFSDFNVRWPHSTELNICTFSHFMSLGHSKINGHITERCRHKVKINEMVKITKSKRAQDTKKSKGNGEWHTYTAYYVFHCLQR